MNIETQFAPTPWYYAIGQTESHNQLWSNSEPNPHILTFNPDHPDLVYNAKLISCAPEMLESLKEIVEFLETRSFPDYFEPTIGNMLMNYRNLINQATTL